MLCVTVLQYFENYKQNFGFQPFVSVYSELVNYRLEQGKKPGQNTSFDEYFYPYGDSDQQDGCRSLCHWPSFDQMQERYDGKFTMTMLAAFKSFSLSKYANKADEVIQKTEDEISYFSFMFRFTK